jgi:hypothetical protein
MKRDLCELTRRLLTDAQGSREGLPPECAAHLGSCEKCGDFATLLAALAETAGEPRVQADYKGIGLAFEAADAIAKKREERRQFALFFGAALLLTSAFAFAGASGHGGIILAFQALAVIVLPFAVIPLIVRRILGGFTWTA